MACAQDQQPCHVKTKPGTETNTEEHGTGERIDATNDTGSITDDSQNQQDTDIQTADILTPKDVCRVGCWIARIFYQTGRQTQVIKEMEKINIEMLGVCETRWTGSGPRKLATEHTIIYSGRKDDHHSRGVCLITNRRLSRFMIGWKPVRDRVQNF